jgi:hypothetical protein
MDTSDSVYGAFSRIYVQCYDSIEQLASKLAEKLNIPELRLENREEEPYDIVGYSEVLGFEIVLQQSRELDKWPEYHFLLEATTTDTLQEMFNNQMFDISLWMARYLALMCKVKTMALKSDKETGQSFYLNKNSWKIESIVVEARK